jgi:hypothetical protein
MPIPGQTITIADPGLGLVEPSPTSPLYLGTCELSTVDTLQSFSNKNAAVTALGQGPLTEAVCRALDIAGGPVRAMRLNGSVAGAWGAVTDNAVGGGTGTVTVATTPFDTYDLIVEILTTGSVASLDFTFKYSLDGGDTYSEAITGAATYLMPNTNSTLTFVDGAGPAFFVAGMTHTAASTAPYYATADLATAVTALLADATEWAFMVLTGTPATTSDGATMFAALATHLSSFETAFRYVRAMMDAGDDTTANALTDFVASTDNRISVCYGTADFASSKAFAGWGTPTRSLVEVAGARAAASLISTDLSRVKSGALTGVTAISHDERTTEVLDQARFTTSRTWIGRPGFYLTNARIKSAPGSDFRYWQHGRIMDVACSSVYVYQQTLISAASRTNADGTINELDAIRFETDGLSQLRAKLTQPDNAEGTRGHVSDLSYVIDQTNNLATTEELLSEVALRPLGYAKTITTTIGFALNV